VLIFRAATEYLVVAVTAKTTGLYMSSKKQKHLAEETLGSFQHLSVTQPSVSKETIDHAIAKLANQAEDDSEMVQLVNARMGRTQMSVVQGMGMAKVWVEPFSVTPPIRKSYGDQIIGSFNRRILVGRESGRLGETQMPDFFLLAAPPPPNYKKTVFEDPTNGVSWDMDQYRPKVGTLRPDGKPMYLSEEQAFYTISKMVSPEAIQRYVREFDSRHTVVQFANRVVAYREESMLRRLGVNPATRSNAMV
jgi:hypothetical protein